VDEVSKALPEVTRYVEDLEGDKEEVRRALSKYDRDENLRLVMERMSGNLGKV